MTIVNIEIQYGKETSLSPLLINNIFDSENLCLIKTREQALEIGLEIYALISDKDQDERKKLVFIRSIYPVAACSYALWRLPDYRDGSKFPA